VARRHHGCFERFRGGAARFRTRNVAAEKEGDGRPSFQSAHLAFMRLFSDVAVFAVSNFDVVARQRLNLSVAAALSAFVNWPAAFLVSRDGALPLL
jgi:hypothetical protein